MRQKGALMQAAGRLLLFAVLLMGTFACAGPQKPIQPAEEEGLAVAPFTQPNEQWEVIAGYLPGDSQRADTEVLQRLNAMLKEELRARGVSPYKEPPLVRQCREIVLYERQDQRLEGLTYWSLVGRCIPARYILVPQLLKWQERVGGEWGVDQPAMVAFDLCLINAREKKLVERFHFEEEQSSLTENIFHWRDFVKRGGRWLTAPELAREGISEGLLELGL
jgi:hypothetical protein